MWASAKRTLQAPAERLRSRRDFPRTSQAGLRGYGPEALVTYLDALDRHLFVLSSVFVCPALEMGVADTLSAPASLCDLRVRMGFWARCSDTPLPLQRCGLATRPATRRSDALPTSYMRVFSDLHFLRRSSLAHHRLCRHCIWRRFRGLFMIYLPRMQDNASTCIFYARCQKGKRHHEKINLVFWSAFDGFRTARSDVRHCCE